jgi:hypothetical protein
MRSDCRLFGDPVHTVAVIDDHPSSGMSALGWFAHRH